MGTAALLFLRLNWKWLAPVVLALGLLGYIKVLHLKIDHYKAEAVAAKAAIAANGELEEQLQAAYSEMSKKYHEAVKNQFALQDSQAATVIERIKKDETSKHVPLTDNDISLFNSLKPAPSVITRTESGNVSPTAPTEEAVTLNRLLLVSAENDANHLKCIIVVEKWQTFWKEFSMAYMAAVNNE